MIRLLIVDDQRLMRDGLSTLLALERDMHIIGTAEDGEQAVDLVMNHRPDIVLMDIRMPNLNGIEATRKIRDLQSTTKVLMLTTFDDREDVVEALSAGAVGYLLKDMPAEEIAAAVRTAHQGGAVLPPGIAKTFLTAVQQSEHSTGRAGAPPDAAVPMPALTDREIDVLHCLARGQSNREIADMLFVTEGTVKNHVSSLIAKLGLRDRTQVALFAVRHGYGV